VEQQEQVELQQRWEQQQLVLVQLVPWAQQEPQQRQVQQRWQVVLMVEQGPAQGLPQAVLEPVVLAHQGTCQQPSISQQDRLVR
jgi:hypothetical protein